MQTYKNIVALNAKTATTVSDVIGVRGAKRITLAFKSARTSSNAIFTVQASLDRTDANSWVDSVIMIPNTPHNASQEEQRVLSATFPTSETRLYALDLENFGYDAIKVKVTENGAGTSSCVALVEY